MESIKSPSRENSQVESEFSESTIFGAAIIRSLCYTRTNVLEGKGAAVSSARTYLCIDLKSFYASVECQARGLDPFTDNLVVADKERGPTTICLAITPAMKALGIPNRCRLFDIPEGVSYVAARPRMRRYMEVSAQIYRTYLRYVSAQDVHVYSIDECFIDATPYLGLYGMDARAFAKELMAAVRQETGICATAGVGSNLFLAKVALDVTAKHASDNIGFLDEGSFKRQVWFHQPITDIWGIGPGIARRLAKYGARDLAGVAALRPETLYREFGVVAEYLIDHAWGQEPCTIAEVRAYEPESHSLVNGQVLPGPYSFDEARMVLGEMVDASVLELVEKGLVCGHVSLSVGYAKGSVPSGAAGGPGAVGDPWELDGASGPSEREEVFDGGHGKRRPGGRFGQAPTGGGRKLDRLTNSRRYLMRRFEELFDETTDRARPVRRLSIGMGDLLPEECATATLFDDVEAEGRERRLQEALVAVRGKFGRNALIKAVSLQEKATACERNNQVGGHRA